MKFTANLVAAIVCAVMTSRAASAGYVMVTIFTALVTVAFAAAAIFAKDS